MNPLQSKPAGVVPAVLYGEPFNDLANPAIEDVSPPVVGFVRLYLVVERYL